MTRRIASVNASRMAFPFVRVVPEGDDLFLQLFRQALQADCDFTHKAVARHVDRILQLSRRDLRHACEKPIQRRTDDGTEINDQHDRRQNAEDGQNDHAVPGLPHEHGHAVALCGHDQDVVLPSGVEVGRMVYHEGVQCFVIFDEDILLVVFLEQSPDSRAADMFGEVVRGVFGFGHDSSAAGDDFDDHGIRPAGALSSRRIFSGSFASSCSLQNRIRKKLFRLVSSITSRKYASWKSAS
ncbi:MAG: hypothetical protein V8T87_13570 [Victivallales bacterium]